MVVEVIDAPWAGVPVRIRWFKRRWICRETTCQIATLDPFQGYKNAIDDQLQDATSVLDAFHIVKLAGDAPGEVRRRVQQDTTGHRGRKGDPLYQIRLLLRASRDRLTKRQKERLREALTGSSELSVGDRVLVGGCG